MGADSQPIPEQGRPLYMDELMEEIIEEIKIDLTPLKPLKF